MPADPSYLKHGLDVEDEDYHKVGSISHIWPNAASTGDVETPGDSFPPYEPVAPEDIPETQHLTAQGIFEVDRGPLGLRGHLYVPFSAIYDIVPGEKVVLNCVSDECERLYSTRPDNLPSS